MRERERDIQTNIKRGEREIMKSIVSILQVSLTEYKCHGEAIEGGRQEDRKTGRQTDRQTGSLSHPAEGHCTRKHNLGSEIR